MTAETAFIASRQRSPVSRDAATRTSLEMMLKPRSVAVVGATDRKGALGQRLLAAVTGGRFQGNVYPVNPNYPAVGGLTAYPDIGSLPEVPDCVAFALPETLIEGAFEAAAAKGVRAAVMFGRAYEAPQPGRPALTARLAAIAKSADMAVCGGNCMGFINFRENLKVSGNPPPAPDAFGPIGFVSHSGSTWSGLIGSQRQLAFNYAISPGQELVTTMSSFVEFLVGQDDTRVIACIVESIRDPENFLRVVELADERGIPLVVLKLGRSEQGKRFALAHSGALAGSHSAYRAVFERRNVISVYNPDELADTIELFANSRRPAAGGIAVACDSGGERQLIVDVAADVGAPISRLADETVARLEAALDPGMEPTNPVDALGDGTNALGECMKILAEDANVGIVALATNMVHGRPYLRQCTSAAEGVYPLTSKPVVAFGHVHSTISREEAQRLREIGISVLMGTQTALQAMKHVIDWENNRRGAEGALARRQPPIPTLDPVLGERVAALPDGPVDPQTAFGLLDAFGIASAPYVFADNSIDAVKGAERLGFPVVLKTAASDILHKTEKGGVILGLADAAAVERAYKEIAARCGPFVQIQRQGKPGVEVILGMTTDEQFGPMMTVGLGGIMTEVFADAVTVQPPISAQEARLHLRRLKSYRLLEEFRGRPATDIGKLATIIERFSVLCAAVGRHFSEIDVNPVIVTPDDCIAVDCLFVARNSPVQHQ